MHSTLSLLPAELLARHQEFDLPITVDVRGLELLTCAAVNAKWIREGLLGNRGLVGELSIEQIAMALGQWLPVALDAAAENLLGASLMMRLTGDPLSADVLVEKLRVAGDLQEDDTEWDSSVTGLFAVDPDAAPVDEKWGGK